MKRPAPTLPKTWKPTEPVASPPKPKVNLAGHEVKRTFWRDEVSKPKKLGWREGIMGLPPVALF